MWVRQTARPLCCAGEQFLQAGGRASSLKHRRKHSLAIERVSKVMCIMRESRYSVLSMALLPCTVEPCIRLENQILSVLLLVFKRHVLCKCIIYQNDQQTAG